MAALISQYSAQGPSEMLSRRFTSCGKEVNLKPVVTLQMVGKLNRCSSLKHYSCLSRKPPHMLQRVVNHLKVSALGGSSENDESGSNNSESVVSSSFVNLSDGTHKAEKTMIGCPDIHELIEKLSMMLRNEAPNPSTRGVFGDAPPQCNVSESQNQIGCQKWQREGEAVKILMTNFYYYKKTRQRTEFFLWIHILILSHNPILSETIAPVWYFRVLILWGVIKYCLDVEWLATICWRTFRLLKRSGFI